MRYNENNLKHQDPVFPISEWQGDEQNWELSDYLLQVENIKELIQEAGSLGLDSVIYWSEGRISNLIAERFSDYNPKFREEKPGLTEIIFTL